MSAASLGHPSGEMLEMYTLSQLPTESCDMVEEHLLVCPPCQDRLTEVEQYIVAMKEACRAVPAPAPTLQKRTGIFTNWIQMPAFGWAVGAIAGVMLLTALPFPHGAQRSGPETEIHLTASRGSLSQQVTNYANLRLVIDSADLPALDTYKISIVGQTGITLWKTETAAAPQLSLRVDSHLSTGTYWVRIHNRSGELLREFSLILK